MASDLLQDEREDPQNKKRKPKQLCQLKIFTL